ncbi:MAG TPA: cob(I)yrinic acid a,c-diamide adenosyltransferase [Candidatus Dormibacteraeota bacterium]|nr:cob(I)yrinic acid a,c-diamide adenosyltransferase [Candidatus Dormibacteraeota bacterium]
MVRLTRIYTKTGDKGTTALGDGRRVSKDAPRIEAFGSVDELNAVLGLAILSLADDAAADLLRTIQNDLFDLGADLCVPERPKSGRAKRARPPLRITEDHVRPLEQAIDRFNAALDPLTSFVLPGGTAASAWLHLARTVCRRAERHVVALGRKETLNPQSVVYLNRLSDLLFVMARRANEGGRADVLWVPGGFATTKP